jgi:hypothetical protein
LQFGVSVYLAHATRDDESPLLLSESCELAGPEHQILAIHLGRELLPLLRIEPPLMLQFVAHALQFLKGPRLVLRCLNRQASLAKELITRFDGVCVGRIILDLRIAMLPRPSDERPREATLHGGDGEGRGRCRLHSLVETAMITVKLLEV